MDKYRRVDKARREEDAAPVGPNEVRITQQGKVRAYITYASSLLTQEKEREVVLKAMGHAISKAVTVAEVLKHRVAGLHQVTRLSSVETVDVFEPLEEGLDRVESTRHIPGISIQLSLDPLDAREPGYQAPLPASQVSPPLAAAQAVRGVGGELKPPRRPRKARDRKADRRQGEDDANTDEEAATAEQEQDEGIGREEGDGQAVASKPQGGRRGRGPRRGRGGGGRGAGGSDAAASREDAKEPAIGPPDHAAASTETAVPDSHPSASGGKRSGRSRRSGKKKKAVAAPLSGGGDVPKEHANGAGASDGDRGVGNDPTLEDTRGRGRGGRGRSEPKVSSKEHEGPAAVAAD